MKKKLLALSLALLLSLSVIPSGLSARAQEPDPTPIVTLQPVDPDKPGEPPAEPQGDPNEPPGGKTPEPDPIGRG